MSDRWQLTIDEAIGILPDDEYIHTVIANGGWGGCDWKRLDIEAHIRAAGGASLAGPLAMRMGHGLCLDERRRLFATHDPERLAALEAKIAAEPEPEATAPTVQT